MFSNSWAQIVISNVDLLFFLTKLIDFELLTLKKLKIVNFVNKIWLSVYKFCPCLQRRLRDVLKSFARMFKKTISNSCIPKLVRRSIAPFGWKPNKNTPVFLRETWTFKKCYHCTFLLMQFWLKTYMFARFNETCSHNNLGQTWIGSVHFKSLI